MKKLSLLCGVLLVAASMSGLWAGSKGTEKKSASSSERWVITAYSSGPACNGKYGPYAAYGGQRLKWGMIAADWRVLKPGSRVKIEGFGDRVFTVMDRGSGVKGKHIDVYIPNVSARQMYVFGKKKLRVEVLGSSNRLHTTQIDEDNTKVIASYSFLPKGDTYSRGE
ncbi:MAG: 3D domain-containing protein [Verrucomicrobiae bacterium]|nr:3D domain-containing protein [Verrucomicrobiae bacterium]